MKKAEKPLFVSNLSQELKDCSTCLLLDYSGLSVANQRELKKRLKTVAARFLVTKNTLFKLAAKEANLPEEILADTVLQGQTALVLTEADPLAPLQIIAKFIQEFEIPQFKVGFIEGKFNDKETLLKLSQLPTKDVLFSQVVGSSASPLYALVSVTQANIQQLLYVLKAKGGE